MPALTCSQAQSQGDVRLPRATVAQQQDVLAAGEELASCEFQYSGSVQRRDGQEVEAVYGLDDWELRLADAAFRGAALAVQQLEFGDAQQVVLVVPLLDGALSRYLVILAQDGGQPQFVQMMFDQQLQRVRCMRFSVGSTNLCAVSV